MAPHSIPEHPAARDPELYRHVLETEILPRVEKPSRYLGNELNSVRKDVESVALRACLAFPDSYDLGLGNLGIQILYHILNQQEAAWAERVYAPHPDMETELRRRGMPLASLESHTPLSGFDILGFTLQWELNYTNILNMLDLGGVPVLSADRSDEHPIVIAGGPCVFNPEPLAMFIDCFVVGDGEEAILEMAQAVLDGGGRQAILERLSKIEGMYVPSLYPMEISPEGVMVPPVDGPRITKRLVRDLDETPFPTDYLVPYTEQVHDRVGLEVLRGCTQGCRFCQAGMVTRPVRERSLEKLAELQQEVMEKTGYEEISLVSLSTCDYSKVKNLVKQSVELAREDHIAVSLPSLRLDSFSVDLANTVSSIRKTGLTFAPEAATDRMRAVINKFIPTEELLEMSRQCYSYGWDTVKLYFMIGQPTEQDEDVEAIGDLATQVFRVGRKIRNRTRVNLGVSTFVPKPQTPFQWAEQIGIEETERRQSLLAKRLPKGKGGVKFGKHNAWETYLEGLVTRADRRAGWLLLYAWEEGARFDGWHEYLKLDAWQRAIERWQSEQGMSADHELRARGLDERLPWDHIHVMIPKGWLRADYERAIANAWAKDCRNAASKCHQCGVIKEEMRACTGMLKKSRKGAKAEEGMQLEPPPRWEEPKAEGRVRFRFSRTGPLRFLSHKEMINVMIRALRRAHVPMRYSEGYHPHAAVSFTSALPVGMETSGDWCDVVLTHEVDPQAFTQLLNNTLPDGVVVLEAYWLEGKQRPLMALVQGDRYRITLPSTLGHKLVTRVATFLDQRMIHVTRQRFKGGRRTSRTLDIRPMIRRLTVEGDGRTLDVLLVKSGDLPGKVEEVLRALFSDIAPESLQEALYATVVHKVATYTTDPTTAEDDVVHNPEAGLKLPRPDQSVSLPATVATR
ncbi:MAG: TIGR03960 family B12-binding radical SAM protein [Bradymonadia bacterium]